MAKNVGDKVRDTVAGNASDPKTDAPARGSGDEPDVLLDVPKLTVEEISLEVDNLHAQIALEARLADLVQLRVGADVEIERVALEIKGVEAQAQLKARLDNVLAIIERALDTVDNNPELLTELARSTQRAAGGLGETVAKVGEEGGQLVEGTLEEAGQLADGTVEEAGQLAEGAPQATGSSSGRRRRRSRANGGGSESGSKPRKRKPSRP
jgi:hypothetical protein